MVITVSHEFTRKHQGYVYIWPHLPLRTVNLSSAANDSWRNDVAAQFVGAAAGSSNDERVRASDVDGDGDDKGDGDGMSRLGKRLRSGLAPLPSPCPSPALSACLEVSDASVVSGDEGAEARSGWPCNSKDGQHCKGKDGAGGTSAIGSGDDSSLVDLSVLTAQMNDERKQVSGSLSPFLPPSSPTPLSLLTAQTNDERKQVLVSLSLLSSLTLTLTLVLALAIYLS